MKTSFVNLSNTESIAYVEKGEEYKDQKPTLLSGGMTPLMLLSRTNTIL